MKKKMSQNKVDAIGGGLALLLGIGFLGDVFQLWDFNFFQGWWVLFLYIPAICGFLTKGITAGGVLLTITAIILTVGIFVDLDIRLWGLGLIIFVAYIGVKSFYEKWKSPDDN